MAISREIVLESRLRDDARAADAGRSLSGTALTWREEQIFYLLAIIVNRQGMVKYVLVRLLSRVITANKKVNENFNKLDEKELLVSYILNIK